MSDLTATTTPPDFLDTSQDAPATDTGDAPRRKAMNATEAAKGNFSGTAAEADDAIKKWAQNVRERSESGAQQDAEQARRDRNAGIFDSGGQDEKQPNEQPAAEETGGSWEEEPWNKPGAVQPAPEDESGLSRFRVAKPIALEVPADVHHIDQSMVDEFGHVAVRENFSPGFAQALVGVVAEGIKGEKLDDPDRTMSALRWEFGDQTDVLLREVHKFVEKRPALAAFLDESLTGNSVSTIKLLAAAAREPALLTKAGAEKFIAGLKENKKYRDGDKLEIAKARLAFTVAG